jgi:hypothetical protein
LTYLDQVEKPEMENGRKRKTALEDKRGAIYNSIVIMA